MGDELEGEEGAEDPPAPAEPEQPEEPPEVIHKQEYVQLVTKLYRALSDVQG